MVGALHAERWRHRAWPHARRSLTHMRHHIAPHGTAHDTALRHARRATAPTAHPPLVRHLRQLATGETRAHAAQPGYHGCHAYHTARYPLARGVARGAGLRLPQLLFICRSALPRLRGLLRLPRGAQRHYLSTKAKPPAEMPKKQMVPKKSELMKLAQLAQSEKRNIATAIVLLMFSTSVTLSVPMGIKYIIDIITENKDAFLMNENLAATGSVLGCIFVRALPTIPMCAYHTCPPPPLSLSLSLSLSLCVSASLFLSVCQRLSFCVCVSVR